MLARSHHRDGLGNGGCCEVGEPAGLLCAATARNDQMSRATGPSGRPTEAAEHRLCTRPAFHAFEWKTHGQTGLLLRTHKHESSERHGKALFKAIRLQRSRGGVARGWSRRGRVPSTASPVPSTAIPRPRCKLFYPSFSFPLRPHRRLRTALCRHIHRTCTVTRTLVYWNASTI